MQNGLPNCDLTSLTGDSFGRAGHSMDIATTGLAFALFHQYTYQT